MSAIKKPNYTQIPNVILDKLMLSMSDAELRVVLVIARQTFGYHRQRKKMSISYLMKATGMSKQGVLNGINSAIERGVVKRRKDGQSWQYELVIDGEPVNEVDRPTSQRSRQVGASTSQRSRQALVNDVDRLLVNDVDTKKEREKERKPKKKTLPAAASYVYKESAPQPAQPAAADREANPLIQKLLSLGVDESLITPILKGWRKYTGRALTEDDVDAWLAHMDDENGRGRNVGVGLLVSRLKIGKRAPEKFYISNEPAIGISLHVME
jgi:phage replication O-like protein O